MILAANVRSRSDWEDAVIGLDASTGRERFREDGGAHGQHFQGPLALAGSRVFYVANTTPQLRVLDDAGHLVWGGSLKTEFVVSTEVVGGFVEPLRGKAVLAQPWLLVAREKVGLVAFAVK